MRTVILVPRRDDNGHRDRLWAALRRRWETLHPDWPIVEGHHEEGPFNRSAAVNRAAREAGDWDVAVIIDSDVFLPPENVLAAVETAVQTGKVTWAHRDWRGLTERGTARLLRDHEATLRPDLALGSDWGEHPWPDGMCKTNHGPDIDRHTPLSWSCCIALTREAWDRIGGFDERFKGWGWEDMAFQSAACGLVGAERIDGSVYHLWHRRAPGNGRMDLSAEGLTNQRLGRRYMMALRRDHRLHDRVNAADEAEFQRDMGNLRRADARIERFARQRGLPDWSGWWPTLDELVGGKVTSRTATLIVHSGGLPETWEARSAYLVRALVSLSERIDYPWERRVIFSDWGWDNDEHVALMAIAREHGYEVIALEARVGYTKSMRELWKFLRQQVISEHVFLTEDDFLIDRDVDIEAMAKVLDQHSEIVQMALLRGPFYPAEMDPETILGHPRDAFTERRNGAGTWLEHRRFFTANPALMPRSIALWPWPKTLHSEAVFGRSLFRNRPESRAAFWGSGEPWVSHIGEVRGAAVY